MGYVVSLKQFDGPLDLLLTLISRAKVDIRDIFVSEITEQYLDSMNGLAELNMDTASEFLAMAATLLEIKSRAMLPRPPKETEGEEEETPEQALIRRLTEYKAFKEASGDLKQLEGAAQKLLSKLPEEYPLPPPEVELTGLTLDKLTRAFARVLLRLENQEGEAARPRQIRRDAYTVQECIFRIQTRLRNGPIRFDQLFEERPGKDEVVSVFVALLELIKLNRVAVAQAHPFAPITLARAARTDGRKGEDGNQYG